MNSYNKTEDSSEVKGYLMNWLSVSADNIVILILLLALAIKFIFFEDKEDIAKQLQFKIEDDTEEKIESEYMKEKKFEIEYVKENENEDMSFSFLTTKMPFKLSFAKMQTISIPWIDGKEEQIDKKQCTVDTSSDKNLFSRIPRSIEECLKIYKSEVSKSVINMYLYIFFQFFIYF